MRTVISLTFLSSNRTRKLGLSLIDYAVGLHQGGARTQLTRSLSVGARGDELVRESVPLDPLFPVKRFLKHDPIILTIGQGFTSIVEIHLAEEGRVPTKFARERALTISSKGPAWIDVLSLGCGQGFTRMSTEVRNGEFKEAYIGSAQARVLSLKRLVEHARTLLDSDPTALSCKRPACLSCPR
jgi:aminoglycoside N3'-acetyltransferase